jgi:LasA protease
MRRYQLPLVSLLFLLLAAVACVREPSGPVIIVTATPPDPIGIQTRQPGDETPVALPTVPPTSAALPQGLIVPTMDPPRLNTPEPLPESYIVQPGDSLSNIANRFGTTVEQLMALNNIENASLISVGLVLRLPETTTVFSPEFKIIPDSELVRSPATADFDIAGYVAALPGLISRTTDEVEGDTIGAAEVIRRVADDYSVNPRLLLALLEYRAGWLFNPEPDETTLIYPMGYEQFGYEGLYMQLAWTANRLNEGYYGWRLRDNLWFTFDDGIQVAYAPGLNAGTVAVQYMLSRNRDYNAWLPEVAPTGLYSAYVDLFGDPFAYAIEPLLPVNLAQPALQLPWSQGELWYYTGGPHGGYGTGSAWSAIDFAPPGDEDTRGCFIAPQWTVAVADGIITRSERGFVILDLDGDANETTGWTIVYLHLAAEGRVAAGTVVRAGDPLGKPSCEGGVSNATHLHIARQYNGEWIPAHCHRCASGIPDSPFVMGGWTVRGWENQEYQGYMISGGEYRQAEQGRDTPINEVEW